MEDILDSQEVNKNQTKTTSWRWLTITEIVLIVLTLIGVVFKIMHWAGGSFMTLIGLAGLCLLYISLFIPMVRAFNVSTGTRLLITISGLVLGVTVIGILFKWMIWAGGDQMALLGYAAVGLAILFYVLRNTKLSGVKSHKAVLRLSIYGLIAIGLFHMSPRQLFDFNLNFRASDNFLDAFEATLKRPVDAADRERYLRLREQHFDSITRIDYPETFQQMPNE